MQRIDEEERRKNFNFKRDVLAPGEQDENLAHWIKNTKHFKDYFKDDEPPPPILNGEDYKVLAYVARGSYGFVVLAEERNSRDDVIIKIPHKPCDGKRICLLINEYMYHKKAYEVMIGKCRTTKPIGSIRQSLGSRQPHIYMIVSKYCPLVPGYYSSLTLSEALLLHAKKPICRKIEWRNICLSLIRGVQTLQWNDIYHNDIKLNNVLLEISGDEIVPVLIDFGEACSSTQGDEEKKTYFARPHVAPELLQQQTPHPTSDLYSVVYTILRISTVLELPTLEHYCTEYRQKKLEDRVGHEEVCKEIMDKFNEFKGTIDLTVDDTVPPLLGK